MNIDAKKSPCHLESYAFFSQIWLYYTFFFWVDLLKLRQTFTIRIHTGLISTDCGENKAQHPAGGFTAAWRWPIRTAPVKNRNHRPNLSELPRTAAQKIKKCSPGVYKNYVLRAGLLASSLWEPVVLSDREGRFRLVYIPENEVMLDE